MASQWSDLKIQLMQTGENSGTWGNVTNANLTALEEAIAESVDVTFASADVTLTLTNSNSSQSARYLRLRCTGTTAGARSLILGSGCQIEKLYLVSNGCADAITVKNTSGSGVIVPSGRTMFVYNNATDVVDAVTHLTSLTLASALPVASGGTGSTTATFSGANITSLNATNVSSGTLSVDRGGTGQTSYTDGQLLIGNSAGGLTKATLSNGSGITITNGNGSISIAATGGGGGGTVTAVGTTGNVNGVTLTGGTITSSGTITLGGSVNVSTISTGVLATAYGGTGSSTLDGAGIATLSGTQFFTGTKYFNSTLYINTGSGGGIVSDAYNFTVSGNSLFWTGSEMHVLTGSTMRFFVGSSSAGFSISNVSKVGGGEFAVYSDRRYKQDITPYTKSVTDILQLNPVNYRYTAAFMHSDEPSQPFVGLLAQDVQETSFADCVSINADGYCMLDSSEMLFALINSVKQLSAEVNTLKAEVAALKGA